jgi:aarF domain-containing kinase
MIARYFICVIFIKVLSAYQSPYSRTRCHVKPISAVAVSPLTTGADSDTVAVDGVVSPSLEDVVTTRETQETGGLTVMQRVSRTLSFYSDAVPVLLAYLSLDKQIEFERNILGKEVSKADEEARRNKLHDWGSIRISDAITRLKGFYVKTGQIISTRVDIFPEQYTSKLAVMQDALDPIDVDTVKEIVRKELLQGAPLSDLFHSFDSEPLGSASIAQVHKAMLIDGRTVAVKVQRPGIKDKLLGDIGNLINFAGAIKALLPIDYYKVFCELERTLIYELDFLFEAQATQKVAAAVSHSPSNLARDAPVIVPLPVSGLVSKRVMVLEYVSGTPLSQIAKKMEQGGSEGSDGSKPATAAEKEFFGRKLLGALTDAYANMIFGSGIIHGDPHPGNIFITDSAEVALLDCGQVKVLNTDQRVRLAQLVYDVNEWETANAAFGMDAPQTRALTRSLAASVRSFGVFFREGSPDECAAAVAILLFGNTGTKLPGGYAGEEISADSPIVDVIEFPQEFVLLGRATVMIKGIANRLGLAWGLSDRWAPVAREAMDGDDKSRLPAWSAAEPMPAIVQAVMKPPLGVADQPSLRFRNVLASFVSSIRVLRKYMRVKVMRFAASHMPSGLRQHVVKILVFIQSLRGRKATANIAATTVAANNVRT